MPSWLDNTVHATALALALSESSVWIMAIGLVPALISLYLLVRLGTGASKKRQGPSGHARTPVNGDESAGDIEEATPEPEDRMVPLGREGFMLLVGAIAAALWTLGLVLSGDQRAFIRTPEWQFQPFYIAAHLVTLRLFVSVFTHNFRRGVVELACSPAGPIASMRRSLGALGALWAAVIAIPFCLSDWRYLTGGRYEPLVPAMGLTPVDYLMWCIWTAEWFLNAFIWVIIASFLFNNVRLLHRYAFAEPIEVVLQEKRYRPFLRMSSQGATVVLLFGIITVFYIWYTGGAITDYLGLAITGALLVVGFFVPWTLLRRKVHHAVLEERGRLQISLALGAERAEAEAHNGGPVTAADIKALSERVDYALSLLRFNHLEHLERMHLRLGATEAKAVAVRMLAPAATIGWQVVQNSAVLKERVMHIMHDVIQRITMLIS